jgi:hypothetical protein
MDREFEPMPVRQSGLGGRASLVAVAAVLSSLVVVAVAATSPRQIASTAPSASATTLAATAVPVSSPALIAPTIVIEAKAFGAGLALGRFDGSTVLVRGEIEPGQTSAVPACFYEGRCYAGMLASEPPVGVEIPFVATDPEDGGVLLHNDRMAWPWWQVMSPPQHGLLALSVSGEGAVRFVGTVRDAALDLTVADLVALDMDLTPLDEVVVATGWLGRAMPVPCQAPRDSPPDLAALPSRACSSDRLEDSVDSVVGVSLGVQQSAYDRFAPDSEAEPPTPQLGRYALARRLYGSGCESEPPCWGWQVVGRLGAEQAGAAEASPSPAPPATPVVAPTFSQTSRAVDGDFALMLAVSEADIAAGDPIQLDAALEYRGAASSITVSGDGALFAFAFDQLDGPVETQPASRLTCGSFELQRGQPLGRTYGYGGFYVLESDKADFNRLFPGVSGLRLTAGTYRLSVTAGFAVGPDCYAFSDYQVLQTSIVIEVH